MIKIIFITLSLLFLVSCVNNKLKISSNEITDVQSESSVELGYKCTKTISVGSHIPTKKCTTKKQREANKIESDLIKSAIRNQRQNQTSETNKN